ncbi:MAG: hypothetical protein EOP05_16500 [Proteobacteria bacterium]|nr:MAG: hypothetical protein EOP05_16500 [Pseudomonadota bacterium]
MRLGNRDWLSASHSNKNAKDYVRFSYHPSTTFERIVIDTGMNTFNYNGYTNFTSAEWREPAGDAIDIISSSSDFTKVGDSITFRQTLTIDSVLNTITITIEPISSNVDMTGWKTSTNQVWQFDAPISTPDAPTGTPRRGFDLSNVYGAAPMLMSDFLNQTFQLGFSANGSIRACEFADLKVTVKN